MQTIALYLIESMICSAIFAAYYWRFLRNGYFFRWNRFYLLLSALAALIIPLIHIPVYVVVTQLPTVIYDEELASIPLSMSVEQMQATNTGIGIKDILLALYGLTVFVLVIFEVRSLWKIYLLKKGVSPLKVDNVKVYRVNSQSAPFSFFNTIFWRSEIDINSSDGQRILKHELTHIKAYHTCDKLFMQLLCTVFWMNPVFWLLKRELNMVHEYVADSASVENNDTQRLSALILCSLYPNYYLEFTNQFFQSSIKRRIIMLSKNFQKQKFSLLRKLMSIPVALMTLGIFAVNIEAKLMPENEDVVSYEDAAVKPLFNNGNAKDGFKKWISPQLSYPQEALEKGVTGLVSVKFTIDTEGLVKNVTAINNPLSLFNDVIDVIATSSSKWTPGKDAGGNLIPVSFKFSALFVIEGEPIPDDNLADVIITSAKAKKAVEKADNLSSAQLKPSTGEKPEVVPFADVEVKPKFQDKEAAEFTKWIYSQLKYPLEAIEKNIQGTVRVSFVINSDGTLSDIKSIRKVDTILENAVIDIVKKSPKWTPGQHKNKDVNVPYQIPVVFKLQDNPEKKTTGKKDSTKVSTKPNKVSDDFVPYVDVEVKPKFQDKEATEFTKWIYSQLKYPLEAMEKNIQGTVRVSFIINTDGTLSDIKSIHKADPLLENAVIDIVKKSPKWTPGRHKNKDVKVPYQIPIVFKLG
jgi:TonB family protein